MSHKVHPKSFRIKNMADWDSRGFYKKPAIYLEEDFRIRQILDKKIGKSGVEKIEIERFAEKINIIISSARPGLIIGRGGEEVENLKRIIEKEISKKKITETLQRMEERYLKKIPVLVQEIDKKKIKKTDAKSGKGRREIRIEIREIKNPWTSANLTGQWIVQQIEKRVPFRKVLKQAIAKVTANKEIKGIKIEISGRLNGTEIARREWLKVGRLPLQTLRSDIDYSKNEAHCTYGSVGIKTWLYKGEKFD